MEMTTPTAAPCLRCHTTGGLLGHDTLRPRRSRGLCQRCYDHEFYHGRHVEWPAHYRYGEPITIPTGIITPQMLGITADQPPTDPNLTPRVVWEVGNKNARRALQWLVAHAGLEETQALARVVWMPADVLNTARRAA